MHSLIILILGMLAVVFVVKKVFKLAITVFVVMLMYYAITHIASL